MHCNAFAAKQVIQYLPGRDDGSVQHGRSVIYDCLVTGSIARSATRWYLSYSEADFEVFRPAWATRCTDGVKFGMEEGTAPCQISPPSVQR